MANTENEVELFRGNSTCTRMLSAFAKIDGYTYLRSLIVPLVKTMESLPPGQSYVLDPTLVPADQREQNQRNVEVVATGFLNIITASVPAIPSMLREVCAHIGKAIMRYWPEAKFAALGAFIFLRFISPAVVSPAVVDVELPKENAETIRKGLMIVAKIIQNLENNIFFGKEAHMASLNDFLHANIIHVTKYLSELSRYVPAPGEEEEAWTGAPHDDTDTIVLHRFFDKHADKVGKELLSVHKAPAEGGERGGCRAQHADFRDLMSRYARRSTASVRDLFVETYTPKTEAAVFVLFLCKFDVETLDIDLLLYHVFSKLTQPEFAYRQFCMIYDWTGFGQGSQLPMQWIKYIMEMVSSDIRSRFKTSYHLNINASAYAYLKRIHNVTAGATLARSARACSNIEELLKMEVAEHFCGILMRHHHAVRVPVALEVGTSHLWVLADKALPVGPSLACKPVEIIPFAEISDVYNVSSAAHDLGEFIIRKTRQAATLYFSTPARDQIVKSIRTAKGRMRSTSLPGTERFSRLRNVSAALLHISFLNLGADSSELRGASYELLASVISSFDLDTNPMLSTKGLFPLGGSTATAITPILSEKIAGGVPHLTLDFVSEVCSTLNKSEPATRMHCMAYMAPWLRNLSLFVDPTSACYDGSGAKLRDCVRLLIELTLADPAQIMAIQKTGRLDSLFSSHCGDPAQHQRGPEDHVKATVAMRSRPTSLPARLRHPSTSVWPAPFAFVIVHGPHRIALSELFSKTSALVHPGSTINRASSPA
ncbi:unnamed protein product [Peniophora sp. CBMAI 1063]|nr:unnamed protein product [Peniophora sp. CBMAI 1063]